MMEVQKKETGQVFWACRSCMNFAHSITTKVQEVNQKVEVLRGQVEENKEGVAKANEGVKKVEKKVEKIEKKIEESEHRMEDIMFEEMRAREAIKRNVVIHGVRDPDNRVKTDKERLDWDMEECDKIFRATGANVRKKDIRFCRRIGERGLERRPILVGMKNEVLKAELLDAARSLKDTDYHTVSIGPDQTRSQRQADKKLNEKVEQKNREELTQEDLAKNLKWVAVGQKGEKRIVKAPVREDMEAGGSHRGGGRGRGGRGSWRGRGPSHNNRGDRYSNSNSSQGRERSRERSRERTRERNRETSTNAMEEGEENEEEQGEGMGKRTRNSGTDTEEEETMPPRSRNRQ
jgi:hypothetical protein